MLVIKTRDHEKNCMFPIIRKKKETNIAHEINPDVMIN